MTWDEYVSKHPVREDILNRMNELREFWHNNSVLEDFYCDEICGVKIQKRKWNTDGAHNNWVVLLNDFYKGLLRTVSNEDGIAVCYVAQHEYHFQYSTNLTKLATWPLLVEKYRSILHI